MKERTKIALTIGGILLLIVGTISISFAFLSISKKQELANTFTSGCLNISIENESNAINLSSIKPVTDLEGLNAEGYTFTIKNTCNTSTNYMINLESLNQTSNTLDTQYIKASLSSYTMDNLIQKLESNLVTKSYIENAYVAHNLYKGTIEGNSTKEFNLKLWMDYDTTKEQGANKTYTSKINVIANPDLEPTNTAEIKTNLIDNNTLEGTITGSVTNINYCTSETNKCEPNINTTITNNKINITLNREKEQIVCTKLDSNKTVCSNYIGIYIPPTSETTLAKLNINPSYIKEGNPDFTKTATGAETVADNGIYKMADPMYKGETYYWRGAATSNHVIFADKCWRIVRINGDGSIRLIYNGTPSGTAPNQTCQANPGAGSIAVTSQTYNASRDNASYVGYTYTVSEPRPTPTTGGTESNLKTQTETWYNNNIGNNETYKEKVAEGKYCNDRKPQTGQSYGTLAFNYAAYERLYTNKTPTLGCDAQDVYTLTVGAITADEVSMAGGVYGSTNSSYYLYNGQYYWTMSPSYWYGSYAYVFRVYDGGNLDSEYVYFTRGVRPVINLKSNTEFATGGEGTTSKPYVVQ